MAGGELIDVHRNIKLICSRVSIINRTALRLTNQSNLEWLTQVLDQMK